VLNCPNHTQGGTLPKVGETYQEYADGNGKDESTLVDVIYISCGEKSYEGRIKGIYAQREFYIPDDILLQPGEPQYLSTIFWKHSLQLNGTKEVQVSFDTSDVTGEFRVIVQGVTNKDVVYGEQSFIVTKP
jgi:hypothetical protein